MVSSRPLCPSFSLSLSSSFFCLLFFYSISRYFSRLSFSHSLNLFFFFFIRPLNPLLLFLPLSLLLFKEKIAFLFSTVTGCHLLHLCICSCYTFIHQLLLLLTLLCCLYYNISFPLLFFGRSYCASCSPFVFLFACDQKEKETRDPFEIWKPEAHAGCA